MLAKYIKRKKNKERVIHKRAEVEGKKKVLYA